MKNKLTAKIGKMSKKTLCVILSMAILLSSISVGLIISASDDYYAMPILSEYHVMPLVMSDDASLHSKFDNEARYFYPRPHDSLIEVRNRKTGYYGIGSVSLSWRGSYFGDVYGKITVVRTNSGPYFGVQNSADFESKMLAYGFAREEVLKKPGHSASDKYLGNRDSGWKDYGEAYIDLTSSIVIKDIMVVTRDAKVPTVSGVSMNIVDDVPHLYMNYSENLRVSAAETVDAQVLETMKVRILLVPRKEQSETPIAVTARAVDFSNGRIVFRVDDADENKALYKEISKDESHTGHNLLVSDEAAGIEWVGYDALYDEEWKITYVSDMSEYGSYPIQTTAGIIEGYNATLPLTDFAGNQISINSNMDVRRGNVTLDVVNPTAELAQMSGTSIKAESDKTNLEEETWPADISRVDLFSGMGEDGKGEVIDADIIMSERVHIVQGSLSDIKLEWSITDGNGNPITTPLVSVDNCRRTVNSEVVSKLNFASFNITADMQSNGAQIKPVRIINASYISDMTGNRVNEDTETEKYFSPVISHQTFLDVTGPTVTIGTEGVFRVNDEAYTPASEDEAYYIISLDIYDSKVESAGGGTALGSGITSSVLSQVSLASYEGAPNVSYQYQMMTETDYVSGTLKHSGTIGAGSTPSDFEIPKEGTMYMHLKMYPEAETEISDEQGITAQFILRDAKGNESRIGIPLVELGLDDKAPEIEKLSVKDIESLTVTAQAKDTNKISSFEYQWVEVDAKAAANAWTLLDMSSVDPYTPGFDISYGGSTADSFFNKNLYIRVTDGKGNFAEDVINVFADFEKRNPQYNINGRIDVPAASHSITVLPPYTRQTGSTGGHTRVTVTAGDKTYVRNIELADGETAELFDFSENAGWYEVTVADGKYASVTAGVTPVLDYYGYITVDFAASSAAFVPVVGADVVPADDPHFATADSVSVANAPAKDNVHSVELSGAYALDGSALQAVTSGDYTYYEVSKTLNGIRYDFTLDNALVSEWERTNVDFERSYAVLLKTDGEGNLDTAEEISERFSLGSSRNHSFTLTEKNKNGGLYESGAYIFKVCIAQKNGGTQEFILGEYIVLDNSVLPEVFGVREYTRTVAATYQREYNGPITETITAEDGEVLDTINISVAEPDNHTHITPQLEIAEKDGNPVYAIEHQNAIPAGTTYPSYISTNIVAQYSNVEVLGKNIGKVKGIRYWNKAQPGDYTALEYSVNYAGANQAELYISNYFGWYSEHMESCVVSEEVLAQTDLSRFRTVIGSNTVCYQLIMENGKESPIYTFEINLYDHQVDMELEYELGLTIEKEAVDYTYDEETGEVTDETVIKKETAQYVDVYVTNAYSPVGGLRLYHSKYNSSFNQWEHTEIEDTASPIRLTLSSNGYDGSDSTRNDITGTPECLEFITLVDAVGSAVTAYPILPNEENTADNLYPYGINPEIGTMTVDYYDEEFSTVGTDDRIAHNLVFNRESGSSIGAVVESISVQIDDGAVITLDAEKYSEENSFIYGANDAGIVSFHNAYFSVGDVSYAYRDMIEFVFPYDPGVEAGTQLSHTVKVCGYVDDEEVYTRTFNVTAENTAPYLELYAPVLGENTLYANTYIAASPDVMTYGYYADYISDSFYTDGDYTVKVYDKYGMEYALPITVSGLPTDPVVTFSEKNPTTEPVTITVTSQAGTLEFASDIPKGWSAEGEGTSKLVITATENAKDAYVYCTAENGEDISSVNLSVDNIYPETIDPEIEWQYNTNKVDPQDNTYIGEITAVIRDKNGTQVIDPKTGVSPKFVFVPDGVTEYTFSGYTNIAGATGPDITAELPVTLKSGVTASTESDTYSPDLSITGFATYGTSTQAIEAIYTQTDRTRPEDESFAMADYSETYGEKVYTDIDLLLREIGWADSYVLDVSVLDENSVKLFVTQEAYGSVPDYRNGKSDEVDGVSLIGRTLEISKNTSFSLHAVDKEGNVSSVRFNVTTLGAAAPEPNIVQVLTKAGDEVRVYVLPPNMEGVTNLTITSDGAATETDTSSVFYGYQYMAYKNNEAVVIGYAYDHGGATHKGSIELEIVQIDKSVPTAKEKKWSANYDEYGKLLTNTDISVQLKLNKAICDIYPVDSDGNRIPTPDGITVSFLEDRVTVVYEQNAPEIALKAISAVNRTLTGYINLPEVKTIDKTPAQVTAVTEYAQNRRNAVVSFEANESVILQYSGEKGTQFTEKVTENGTRTYRFADLAGNITAVDVEINGLITEELSLVLATEKDDSSVIDPETYDVDIGDVLYAKTNRDATVTVNTKDAQSIPADTWVAVEIKEDSEGLYPIIKAQDDYGNAAIVQLLRVPVKDRTAPKILVKKNLVSASIDSTVAELEAVMKENIMVSDDVTPAGKLTVAFDYNIGDSGGKYLVTCTVSDENGNEAQRMFWIRIYDGKELTVRVNGEIVEKDDTAIVSAGAQKIELSFTGEPYKFVYKPGIKSVGQMKNGSTPITQGYTDAKENTVTLDLNESGYYSFLVTTQSNETFSFVLYVE